MYKQNYNRYDGEYQSYVEVLEIPEVETTFIQQDRYAMSYCQNIDFITLIVPFGKSNGATEYNSVYVKNELVSYNKMYSEFYGTSVIEEKNFMDTAIELAKRYMDCSELKFDELYPIAFVNNNFLFNGSTQRHKGLVFMGRLQELPEISNISIAQRDINEKINFTNPHNKIIFKIVKDFIMDYRLDENVVVEQKLACQMIKEDVKARKASFLDQQNINIDDYNQFKKKIVDDIKMKKPHMVIDIACGDDDIIYDLLKINIKGGCKVYANDIALSYIQDYHAKKTSYKKIVFTNFNAINAPFKEDAFDVLLCKNLLHHINSSYREELIKNLLKISKQVVLVEILKYEEQNEHGKKIHKDFYSQILNETENKEYLGVTEIKSLLSEVGVTVDYDEIVSTGNGKYYYLWISKK